MPDNRLQIILALKDMATHDFGTAMGRVKKITHEANVAFKRTKIVARQASIAIAAIGAAITPTILAAAKMETFAAQLSAVSDNADYALAAIREFARTSPLATEDVVQSYVRLRAVGIDPTMKQMETLGSVAALFNKQMTESISAFISMEKEPLRNLGIEIDRTGEKAVIQSGNVRKVVEKDAASIRGALMETWAERFPDAMEKASATFTGQWAVMMSNLKEQVLVPLGETLLPHVKEAIDEISAAFTKISDWIKRNQVPIKTFFIGLKDTIFELVRLTVKFANSIGYALGFVERWKDEITEGAAAKAYEEQVDSLTRILELYNKQLEHVSYTSGSLMGLIQQPFEGSDKVEAEISKLTDSLGEYGIALEGGLFERIKAAEDALGILRASVKDTKKVVERELGTGELGPKEPSGSKPSKARQAVVAGRRGGYVGYAAMQDEAAMERQRQARIEHIEWLQGIQQQGFEQEMAIIQAKEAAQLESFDRVSAASMRMSSILTDSTRTGAERAAAALRYMGEIGIQMIQEHLRRFVQAKLVERTTAIATEKAKQAENITTAATEGAGAATAAGKSVANVPYVGPALAAAAIATIFGIVMSMIAKSKSMATGGSGITNGPTMFLAGDNPGGRERFTFEPVSAVGNRGGGSGSTTTINVNDATTGDKLTRMLRNGELDGFTARLAGAL